MRFPKKAIAAAIAALASTSAFADLPLNTAEIINQTAITSSLAVTGGVEVSGEIWVDSQSSATTDNSQLTAGNVAVDINVGNDANVTHGAGNNAQGNIGLNVTSGSSNAQGNEVALSAADAGTVFASAQSFSTQLSTISATAGAGIQNNARIDDALSDVSGSVSVNVASGTNNLQDNQLSASVNACGKIAQASGSNEQSAMGNLAVSALASNSASLTNNALANAQGNVNVNLVAGFGNLQHNSLSIAAAKGY